MNNITTQDQHHSATKVSELAAAFLTVDEASEGQRVDNFLTKTLKGVPKSHVYRILRSGEVRVNKKRIDADFRLSLGDVVRIPPTRSTIADKPEQKIPVAPRFENTIIFEDDAVLVIDKPAGFAVHGGSGISRGVIEQMRLERPKAKFLELVHRLDRETSGVLMLAKKRSALVALHEAIRNNQTDKRYVMLVQGEWLEQKKRVVLDLQKYLLPNGERRVNVVTDVSKDKYNERQTSETMFRLMKNFNHPVLGKFSLLEAQLVTGRTHQLRVQLAHLGFAIVGDDKYGDFALNKALIKSGLKRMFLHSSITKIRHPLTNDKLELIAPMPVELSKFLVKLES
ncbi:RluA family pseudouridine synthase [Methylotenera sp.]|uniref:RluA family pseudouridine synthase n=1 Tax=Methylotenera sp. TaxID=2051956 RepID=UPI00273142FD|nr:RluA family pseudouridine synthase [Methylotenera sp.]MDP2072159.1 RluA family pseudouridine synthase [Methylotenera sp.]MDP3006830.1 RluA family pseudouridine synthase [Methylotenera sp.]MDP3007233.1 RluA family pseudouridine synthase [Methylotenera sp.]